MHKKALVKRLIKFPKSSFFLLGPRGTGKTTWLKYCFPDDPWIDLLDSDTFKLFAANPGRLRQLVEAQPHIKTYIIDEIQYVTSLLPLIHTLIEEDKSLQFILTRSSARKLKKTGVDLLAGRAIPMEMHPFLAKELGHDFSLERALQIGLLPLVWEAPHPEITLKGYGNLYLRTEVQAEGLVRHIGDFARFLEVVSFSHGAILNTSNMARECGITRSTAEGYLQILIDLLLGYMLPVFTKRAKRATVSHSKFYLFDAGVFQWLRPRGPLDRIEEIHGVALEGLVAQHLRSWISAQTESYTFAYWRTRSGVEVDFVVYGPKGFWAIEVKNKTQIFDQDVRALRSFCEDYPECCPLLLYRGKQRLMMKGILCLPCEEFLKQIDPKESIWSEPLK